MGAVLSIPALWPFRELKPHPKGLENVLEIFVFATSPAWFSCPQKGYSCPNTALRTSWPLDDCDTREPLKVNDQRVSSAHFAVMKSVLWAGYDCFCLEIRIATMARDPHKISATPSLQEGEGIIDLGFQVPFSCPPLTAARDLGSGSREVWGGRLTEDAI